MQSKHLQASVRKEPWSIFRAINALPILLLALVIAVVCWLWGRMQNPNEYPIEHVKISTSGQYIPVSDIKNTIAHNIQGGFFSLNIKQLKNSLLNNPWVADVSIRRIWPDSLSVTIHEQQPLARWGITGVLSIQGAVFYPDLRTIPQQLPEIDAPLSVKANAMSYYAQFNQLLNPLGLQVARLAVTKRLAWSVVLSNGVSLALCRDNILDRFTSFTKLYPKLIGTRAQDVVSVNLCYPNALAVRWRGGQAPTI